MKENQVEGRRKRIETLRMSYKITFENFNTGGQFVDLK
jgi:hypothetical protein